MDTYKQNISPRAIRFALLAYCVCHGIIYWLTVKGQLPKFATSLSILVIGLTALAWAVADAKSENIELGGWFMFFIFLLPFIAIPIYFFKHLGKELARRSLRRFLGFFVLMFLCYMAGTFIADWVKIA